MLATLLYTMTLISALYQVLPVFIIQTSKHTHTATLTHSNPYSDTNPNNPLYCLKQNWSRDSLLS